MTFDEASTKYAAEVRVVFAVALHVHQLVQCGQAFKRVFSVEHTTHVHLAQVLLYVATCECSATEQYGNFAEFMFVQRLEVFTHDDGGLHKKTAHSQCVGSNFFHLVNHLLDANLDADVVHFVSVVGADDVHQVLANVVNIALNGCKNQLALCTAFAGLFHELLKVGNSGFHCLGAL